MDTTLTVAFGSQIAAAATRHHLDPRLLAAVAAQETGGPGSDSGRNVVGDGGHGRGVFQIDDRWHAFARTPAAMDPAKNAEYAAGLLSANLQRFGSVRAALTAYNSGSPTGSGTTTDWGDGKPVAYADSVMRHYARLGVDPESPDALRRLAAAAPPAGGSSANDVAAAAAPLLTAGTASPAEPLGGLIAPSLPPYRPIAQADGRDRDVAPSSDLGDDS